MHNIVLPINFSTRECDRLLIRALTTKGTLERSEALWMMFLVWQDFATAREDRRNVPSDIEIRRECATVAVLEEYIGWNREPGGFLDLAIDAGFFLLTPISENEMQLILKDFFPANAVASSVSNGIRGGVSKSFKNALARAEVATADQLQLFRSNGGVDLPGVGEKDVKAAILLVHCVCQALHRPAPSNEVWKATVLAKAVEVVADTEARDRDLVIRWFIFNRRSQLIPDRLDLILERFTSFIPEANQVFASRA